jgi:neutral ceramidase
MSRLDSTCLRVGAGRAVIELPKDLFPLEGFSGVHDPLHARLLLIEARAKLAIVSLELVSLGGESVERLQGAVSEAAGLSRDDVWICVTHTFSAPHLVPKRSSMTPEDLRKQELLFGAVATAVREAAGHAVSSLQQARFGCGTGLCDVNVNRDIPTIEGWWLGRNERGPSDKTVTVARFDTLDGSPLALLFAYGVQSSVMLVPTTAGDTLKVTADLAGAAARFVEREYAGALTAVFCVGAAGDQAPSLSGARFEYTGVDGRHRVKEVEEPGFVIAEMLGARLGAEVVGVSRTLECTHLAGPLRRDRAMVRFPGQKMGSTHLLRPTKAYEFVPADDNHEPIEVAALGDMALVGVRPELGCRTGAGIKEGSPFAVTAVLTMVNGSAKYMAERDAYERSTYEAMNSPFARGSAELMRDKAVGLLAGLRDAASAPGADQRGAAEG